MQRTMLGRDLISAVQIGCSGEAPGDDDFRRFTAGIDRDGDCLLLQHTGKGDVLSLTVTPDKVAGAEEGLSEYKLTEGHVDSLIDTNLADYQVVVLLSSAELLDDATAAALHGS